MIPIIFLLNFVVFLFPLGQLERISLDHSINFYLHDIVIFIAVIWQFYYQKNLILVAKHILEKYRYFYAFFILSLFSLILSLQNFSLIQVLVSSLYLWRLTFYCLFLFLVIRNIKNIDKNNLYDYFRLIIFFSLIAGFLQYFLFPRFDLLYELGWDRHYYRLSGTWLDTGFAGIILTLYILFLVDGIIVEKNKTINQLKGLLSKLGCKKYFDKNIIVDYFLLIFSVIALLLTYSRSSYLALILTIIVYFLLKEPNFKNLKTIFKKCGIILIIIILFLTSVSLLPQKFGEGTKLFRTSTINSRLGNWSQALNISKDNLIFGVGFNTLRYVKNDAKLLDDKWQITHSGAGFDNSLLFLLATSGLVGTYFFLALVKNILKFNNSNLLKASLSAVFIHGMFSNSWFYPWVLLWLFFIIIFKSRISTIT